MARNIQLHLATGMLLILGYVIALVAGHLITNPPVFLQSALAVSGRDVYVGQPGNAYGPGVVYVFRPDAQGVWRDAIKLSEQPIKISNPGILQVRRLRRGAELVGDVIYDSERGLASPVALHDIEEPHRPVLVPVADHAEDLLVAAFVRGKRVGPATSLTAARARAAADLGALSPRTRVQRGCGSFARC